MTGETPVPGTLAGITAASIEHNSLSRATSCSRGWPP